MQTYDVMIEFKAVKAAIDSHGDRKLDELLDSVAHRLQDYSAVVALHGEVLSVEAEIEATDPSTALVTMRDLFVAEMGRVLPSDIIGIPTSFWSTDTARTKAKLLLFKDKTA